MSCRDGFTARGEVRVLNARIGEVLSFEGASLSSPGGQALDLEGVKATALALRPRRPPEGAVNLTNAQIGIFDDDERTWPATLRQHGFAYNTLGNDTIDVRARIRWLERDPGGYVPHIYDQLATAYRRSGWEDAARQVAIAKQRRRRSVLGPAGKLLNWVLYATVGYGYRTWLAGAWLTLLAALGTLVFSRVRMIPDVPHPAPFHPLGYTLDVLLPIVKLGQTTDWQPAGDALYLSWALTGAGWVLTTAVVAALTGVTKRD
jgi:hypothetical protein